MATDHGNCPSCGVDLNGPFIWQHFFDEFTTQGYWKDEAGEYSAKRRVLSCEEAMQVADEVAANYGATRSEGRFGRVMGESRNDRVVAWHCPDCKHSWPR